MLTLSPLYREVTIELVVPAPVRTLTLSPVIEPVAYGRLSVAIWSDIS